MAEKRLIDANIAEKSIRNAEKIIRSEISCDYDRGWADALSSVADLITRMTTVDAVEVVHGRWLPNMEEFDDDPAVGIRGGVFQTGWKCSICGRSEPVKEPYCNCGAKMGGDWNGN